MAGSVGSEKNRDVFFKEKKLLGTVGEFQDTTFMVVKYLLLGLHVSKEKATILVVNSQEAHRAAMVALLREGGHTAIEAVTGNEALEIARLEPGLVVLDIDLPDVDGYEVCRRLKADPATSSIPVIFMTATHLSLQDKLAGLACGADGYFFQPVEPAELLADINTVLRIKSSKCEKDWDAHQWHITFDAISDAICLLDQEGRIIRYNAAFQSISILGSNGLIGRFCHEVIHHTTTFIAKCPFLRARESGNTEELEALVGARWYRIRVGPVAEKNGDSIIYVHVMVDITERRKAEERLRENEELFRNIFKHHTAVKLVVDPATGRIVDANRAAENFYGWSRETLRKMRAQDINTLPPQEVEKAMKEITDRKNTHFEFRHRLADGSIRDVEIFSSPILVKGKELLHSIVHDITERKTAERELLASEKRYHELFRSNPHPMWVYDLETLLFLEVNDAAVAHYNYSRDEFLAMTIKDIRPAEDIPRLMEYVTHADRGMSNSGIWRHIKKDGSLLDVEIITHTLLYDNRPAKMVLVRDITEQLRTQAVSQRLLAAIEQTGETIVVTDPEGVVQYVNPAFERITGYTRDEAVGKKPGIFKSGEHDASFYAELWRTISSGSVWRGRFVNRRKDGSFYNEDAVISPVRDTTGRIINYVAVKRDITESLRLEAQLQQAQKLESVGRLAGGVAHDFNNMLSVILGYTQLALQKINPADSLHKDLKEVHAAATRSATITRQLLAFARKQTIVPQVLDLNTIVEGMLSMIRRLIGEDINLIWKPGTGLISIRMDPSQVDQILANLCVNARDAITNVGNVIIESATVSLDASYCAYHAGTVPGEYVLLSVSDDGCGMDKQTLDKIFEPFFTTKDIGKGTGLGLATVYGIVKQNNGFIGVYSEPDRGTTFKIYLPRYTERKIEGAKEVEITVQSGNGETVLVVEDEIAILRLASRILKNLGYNVLTAGTPNQALGLAQGQKGGIDLLITDVIMPEMNGRDLADHLLSLYPKLRCLFMSGYPASVIANQKVLAEDNNFIQKPFSAKELGDKVGEILLS
jgi:two-component system, cell cycle sensor histidine kinase and response regulator CckA